ncbi:hypothetical protein I2H38_09295 [Microvirga sp. BT350]|uniref:Secreted protein n=1 Tax=Microvirga alba TaxID=2791025 RepID=A0A931FND8_9HYPH|nr:hypothetical protein [Microvirga alba]
MRIMVAAAIFMSILLPVQAQEQLPRTSPSERHVRGINRSLQQEDRFRGLEQQYQIDRNQLRQNLDRQQTFSNPSPRIRNCPPGSVGC